MSAEQIIEDARGYASSVLSDSVSALNAAANAITGVGFLVPNVEVSDPGDLPDVGSLPSLPTLQGAEFSLPADPGAPPQYQDIGGIDLSGAPTPTAVVPTLTMPARPTEAAPFTAALPTINTDGYDFPDPPDQLVNPVFQEPEISDRAAPVKPDIVLPVFDKEAPVFSAVAPEDLSGEMERSYRSISPTMVAVLDGQVDALLGKFCPRYHSSMEALELKLARYMEGGTALSPDVERALVERAKDRDLGEYRRVRDAAWADAADRGFTLPTGALLSAQARARQAASDNIARANTEIVIKQAELEQQNAQFAVTTSLNLRQTVLSTLISYHGNLVSLNGQALDYAKTVASLLVETYNTQVKAFSAQLDAWRAEAAVYETRLKGALALIDLYKAEIEALQALTQVDVARVNVYRARIDSLQALANVYRTRIDAIVSRSQLEKLKIDLFGAQVQAHQAMTQAKANEWTGYRAAIDGEETKVRLYGTQVQADAQAVTIWRGKIDAQTEAVRAAAITNDSRARQYEAALRAYSSIASARGDVARTKLENERQELLAFQADAQARTSFAQARATTFKARADVAVGYADVQMRAQSTMAQSMINYQSTLAMLANNIARNYGQVAGMALSGVNALAIKED